MAFARFKAKRAFRKAHKQANATGEMLCGTLRPDGTPVYWTMPRTVSEEEVRDRAFELLRGRPLDDLERILLRKAEARAKLEDERGYV